MCRSSKTRPFSRQMQTRQMNRGGSCYCPRCMKVLQVGQRVNSWKGKIYHEECWEGLFV